MDNANKRISVKFNSNDILYLGYFFLSCSLETIPDFSCCNSVVISRGGLQKKISHLRSLFSYLLRENLIRCNRLVKSFQTFSKKFKDYTKDCRRPPTVIRGVYFFFLIFFFLFFIFSYFILFFIFLFFAVRRPPSAIHHPPSAVRILVLQSPPAKRTQHFNIVARNMLHAFGHPVATYCKVLDSVG